MQQITIKNRSNSCDRYYQNDRYGRKLLRLKNNLKEGKFDKPIKNYIVYSNCFYFGYIHYSKKNRVGSEIFMKANQKADRQIEYYKSGILTIINSKHAYSTLKMLKNNEMEFLQLSLLYTDMHINDGCLEVNRDCFTLLDQGQTDFFKAKTPSKEGFILNKKNFTKFVKSIDYLNINRI